ncbi:MAG TPA: phage protein Gp36 family protein [Candidatus Limnocylindrales bacterium]|nr:phage protein Gp36 family protein [Candidatus Limnocylindrales bacterium]
MARPYWTLDGLYSKMPKTRVLRLVDLDEEGEIVVSPEPNEAYKRIVIKGTEADNLIDSYLRGHHAVPLDVVPVELVDISNAILATSLFCYSDADELPEFYKDMHKAAVSWLEHVRDNKIQIYVQQVAPVIISVNKTRDDRMFSSDVLDMMR